MIEHASYKYAGSAVNGNVSAPRYVIKQCEEFLKICDGKSEKYFLDTKKLCKIDAILKLLIMPRGLKSGESIFECSCGYQWLFYAAILAICYKNNPQKRRYETVILETVRKNFKIFTIAMVSCCFFVRTQNFEILQPRTGRFVIARSQNGNLKIYKVISLRMYPAASAIGRSFLQPFTKIARTCSVRTPVS